VQALHLKLAATARHLRVWSRSIISDAKLKFLMALDVIQWLDAAQETRELSDAEHTLRKGLKRRVTALAIIERARKWEASRITFLKMGDPNTKLPFQDKCSKKEKLHL